MSSPTNKLTTAQAAELLGVSPNTLIQWRSRHTGPPYVKSGSSGAFQNKNWRVRVYYDRNALNHWLAAREVEARYRYLSTTTELLQGVSRQ